MTHKSVALKVTRERLELMNKKKDKSLLVEDLEEGTSVSVWLAIYKS